VKDLADLQTKHA